MSQALGREASMRLWMLVCAAALAGGGAASAQQGGFPPIEAINVYGLRTLAEDRVRAAIPFSVGDVLDAEPSAEDLAAELGVPRAEYAMVCCGPNGGMLVFVGVEEGEARAPAYRPTPTGDVRLPADVVAAYDAFTQGLIEAVRTGQAGEDRSQGHALSVHPGMRAAQEQFLVFAERDRALLIEVLNGSSDPQHRGIAAHVLGYVADKPAVIDELIGAAFDSHELVRNNAVRALAVMAVYANGTPDTGIAIDAEPFIGMLDSIVWSDRNKSTAVLGGVTQARDPIVLDMLRQRSMPALTEMCRWEGSSHGQPACLMLQRVLGLPDDASPEARPATIAAATELLADTAAE